MGDLRDKIQDASEWDDERGRYIVPLDDADKIIADYESSGATHPQDEREAFEEWAIQGLFAGHVSHKHVFLARNPHGRYVYDSAQQAWQGWQARAALASRIRERG